MNGWEGRSSVVMPKQKKKLWVKIEQIVQCRTTPFGKSFQLKFFGVEKLVWVNLALTALPVEAIKNP